MNTTLLARFTPDILCGAKRLGVDIDALSLALGIPLTKSSRSPKYLNAKQAHALERKTGRTIAELALLGIQCNAPPERRKQEASLFRDALKLMKAFDPAVVPTGSRRESRAVGAAK